MKNATRLSFDSRFATVSAYVAGQTADTIVKLLRDFRRAARITPLDRQQMRYEMSGEQLLRGPISDEYRRAFWL